MTQNHKGGRPPLTQKREPHLVRILPATWIALVEAAKGQRKVGRLLDSKFKAEK